MLKKLHNKESHYFLSAPNIIQIIKSKRMSWTCGTRVIVDKSIQNITRKILMETTTSETYARMEGLYSNGS
jgi:hypothetical protein